MNPRHLNEIKAIIIVALGILVVLSLISYSPNDLSFFTYPPNFPARNITRVFGTGLAGGLFFLIGWISFILPLTIFLCGIEKFKGNKFFLSFRVHGILLFTFSLSGLISMTAQDETLGFSRGGLLGFVFSRFLLTYFGAGAWVIASALVLLSSVLTMEFLVSNFVFNLKDKFEKNFSLNLIKFKPVFSSDCVNILKPQNFRSKAVVLAAEIKEKSSNISSKIEVKVKENSVLSEQKINKEKPIQLKSGDYRLPLLDLLESLPVFSSKKILEDDLTGSAHILRDTLADFGISVNVTNVERGPVLTRYELEPAPGVKVGRILSLSDDIALAMKAQSVRIVAPIPGKSRVGIEVPNISIGAVYLKEVLSSSEFQNALPKLTMALGKDITGKAVVSDLSEMPHLLIAGTTGSGKTVCVNALILSILFRAAPNEVKFLMVDPKMVELTVYNGLPHLLCPVVTDVKKVSGALNWLVSEMDDRYKLLAGAGARNIEMYNRKEEKLPYIVVIIDELADLMMIAAGQVENAITRLAQLSRAVGIHLILATQRPSVDVITGVIKANFPARISFKVASKVDSRTVLDANGADKLLGRGDMLFMRPGEAKLIRAQGALLKDNEIERVVKFIKDQMGVSFNEEIIKEQAKPVAAGEREKDELFTEAARIILESNQASVSILQRRLMLGYTRAARLIDSMEESGIVGAYQGSKPRKILVDRNAWLKEHGFNPIKEE